MPLAIGRNYQLSDDLGIWVDRRGVARDLSEFIPLSAMGHNETVAVHFVSGSFYRMPDGGVVPHAGSKFTVKIGNVEFCYVGRLDGVQELVIPNPCVMVSVPCKTGIRRLPAAGGHQRPVAGSAEDEFMKSVAEFRYS